MAEHRLPNGGWQYGYFCARCGVSINMVGSGHGEGLCDPNPEFVRRLRNANPAPGKKPKFSIMAATNG